MANMGNILKQAQQMQSKITMLKKELEEREVEVSYGGGAIVVKANGKQKITHLKIDDELLQSENADTLHEMLVDAINKAVHDSQEMVSKAMDKVTGGLNIPGLF